MRITPLQTLMCSFNTGTVSVPTTADAIDKSNENFSIASGTASATVQYRQ
jgi:hypothetical protein